MVSTPRDKPHLPEPEPLRVDTDKILAAGIAIWCIALVATLIVPWLHEGDRDWWPWVCVAAIVGGALALAYVRRGRGNASEA